MAPHWAPPPPVPLPMLQVRCKSNITNETGTEVVLIWVLDEVMTIMVCVSRGTGRFPTLCGRFCNDSLFEHPFLIFLYKAPNHMALVRKRNRECRSVKIVAALWKSVDDLGELIVLHFMVV